MDDAEQTPPSSPEARLALARIALERSDLLQACDLARAELEPGEGVKPAGELVHDFARVYVLAVARMGHLDEASQLYRKYGLDKLESVAAQTLGARLLKDAAVSDRPMDPAKLAAAAEVYLDAYRTSSAPHPAINAASLLLMAGRTEAAIALAKEVLAKPLPEPARYFDRAVRAEALMIQRLFPAAQTELAAAARLDDADTAARATTRRQLNLLANTLRLQPAATTRLLAPIAPRPVANYCGHMFDPNPEEERRLAKAVAEVLDREEIGVVYGSLACGADIVIAEQALAQGLELNVVLPFDTEEFVEASVGRGGPWEARFRRCLAAAEDRVTHATNTAFVEDPYQFRYGSDVCMGMACLRAEFLGAETLQIAVWDGADSADIAGTAANIRHWTQTGRRTHVVSTVVPRTVALRRSRAPGIERSIKAIIFTDFAGFSRITEDMLPKFWTEVIGSIADVIRRNSEAIAYRNTWGDALFAVVHNAGEAAEIALQLRDELAKVDPVALKMDHHAGMRIGAHLGPIYSGDDPVCGVTNFYGTEVNRTARIEPVTPPGAVYVTEPFAATLALQEPSRFSCAYMGQIKLPKDFGVQRMYRLARSL